MKTLLLTQDFPPDLGGIARLYGELCRHWSHGEIEVSTVAVSADDPGSGGVAIPDVPIHRMSFDRARGARLTSVARWIRRTERRLRAGDVDVLFAGNIRPGGYVGAWLDHRRGVPYVLYVHGKDVLKERRHAERRRHLRWSSRHILGRAAAIVANSSAVAELVRTSLARLDLPNERVSVVHPGTDPERFRPDAPGAATWRARLGGGPIVLSVSRLMPRKGVDTVLEGLSRVAARHPAMRYVVAGTGPEAERLRRLAADRGVREWVTFIGAVPDDELPALYAAADVFVLPTREEPAQQEVEGFGIVFCEASAAGVPVVGGRSGGVAEAVRDGETGLLVAPGNAGATADALDRLLSDAALRRRLGEGGRRAVLEHYNWRRMADEIGAVLAAAALDRGPHRP